MVRVNDIVEAALAYEEEDAITPGEAMLSVLIDLYTGEEEIDELGPQILRRAWERFSRDLDVSEWQSEWQTVRDGIEVLAANLQEAGDLHLARNLRDLEPPSLDGTPLTAAAPLAKLRRTDGGPLAMEIPVYPQWPMHAGRV
jgi:hypothetical protein